MLRDLRKALELPKLPIMAVELAAYCNDHDFSTYHTWCDEPKSVLNGTDYHLPALRLAQASAEELSDVYMIANLDLGSLHAPHGSIHSVPKDKLGARVALAVRASAVGVGANSTTVVWAGPTATSVRLPLAGSWSCASTCLRGPAGSCYRPASLALRR